MSGLNKRSNSKGPINRSAFRPKGDVVDDLLAMDDATRKAVMGDLKRNRPPAPVESGQQTGQKDDKGGKTAANTGARGPEDVGTQELTTVMLERLNSLERKCEMQRKEMSELNMKLISKTDHLTEEKRRRLKAEDELDAAIAELAQVHTFLSDYGLSWVGGSKPNSRDISPVNAGTEPVVVPGKPFDLYSGGFQQPQPVSQGNQAEMGEEPPAVSSELQPEPPKEGQATAANIGGARMMRNPGAVSTPPAEGGTKLGGVSNAPKVHSLAGAAGAALPKKESAAALPFDLNVLKKNASKLSEMVGFSGVANEAQKAIIKERDVVHVVVYLDGICVNQGPFRPYGWAFCDAFLNDLLDGFFPYEYKEKYPEGYPIDVVDKSKEVCPKGFAAEGNKLGSGDGNENPTAGGGGQKLGGGGGPGKGANNPTTVQSHNDHGYKPLTKDDIMRKLPNQYVTKSGQLINVKEGLNDFVGGSALSQAAGGANPDFNTTVHGGSASATDPESSEHPEATATIQVRMPQGQRVVLHMKKENTVAQLRAELLKAAGSFFKPTHGFDLCTVLPRRSLTDSNDTLESVGLAPRSAVFVQVKKAPAA